MISFIDTACVGLGRAACMPPQAAHVPYAITAAAPSAACFSCSINGLPPTMQYPPVGDEGDAPSTARIYLPL